MPSRLTDIVCTIALIVTEPPVSTPGWWGDNSISENLDYKHLMNVSRIGKVIANQKVPTDEEIFAERPLTPGP